MILSPLFGTVLTIAVATGPFGASSGPPMLTQSALEAVRTWRYKPYQLNGDPVEVETTVNVVFNLGG